MTVLCAGLDETAVSSKTKFAKIAFSADRSPAKIVGSNHIGDMDICLL